MHRLATIAMLTLVFCLGFPPSLNAQDDPFADFDFFFLKGEALENPSVAGPLSGELPIEIGVTQTDAASVELRDFYARAQFVNPYAARRHLFDVGFSLRRTADGSEFRLIVDSAGAWFFKEPQQPETASGRIENFQTRAGAVNEIELVASGDVGYFAVNGEYVGSLDLSARPMKGDVAVGAGYFAEDQLAGERSPYVDFEVWSLDEVLPTGEVAARNLTQLMTDARATASTGPPIADVIPLTMGSVAGLNAGVDVRDFYAHAEFTNPYPAGEHLWDIGFGFRADEAGDLRIVVDSDGAWFLARQPGLIYQSGQGAALNTEAGDQNTLDVVAVDGVGYLAVNGEYVATLDLGARKTSGEVWVSSGFYQEDKIEGASTPFSAFEVWSLDPPPDDAGGSGIVISGEGEVIFDLVKSDGSELFGVVSMYAEGEQTRVEIGAFEATGNEQIGLYAASCAFLSGPPAFVLNAIDPEELTSATTIDAPFADLTTQAYAVAVRDNDPAGTSIACSDVPSL